MLATSIRTLLGTILGIGVVGLISSVAILAFVQGIIQYRKDKKAQRENR